MSHRPVLCLVLGLLAGALTAQEPAAGPPTRAPESPVEVPADEVAAGSATSPLTAREHDARARIAAARRFFAGEGSEDFPGLGDAPVDSPAWIAGRLAELAEQEVRRAAEYLAPPAAGGDRELGPAELGELRALRDRVLDAEAEADGLLRRFLLSVRTFLEDHPDLTGDGLEPLRRELRDRLREAEDAYSRADAAAGRGEAGRRVVEAQRELARLDRLVRGLIRHATVPSADLPAADGDLALLDDPAAAPAARQRLRLLHPFLDGEARAAVEAAAGGRGEDWLPTGAGGTEPRLDPQAEAAMARERADEARQEAETAGAAFEAELLHELAAAEDRTTRSWEEVAGRQAAIAEMVEDFRRRTRTAAESAVAEIAAADADVLYHDLRTLMRELREQVAVARETAVQAGEDLIERRLEVTAEDDRRRDRLDRAAAEGMTDQAGPTFERWRKTLDRWLLCAETRAAAEERLQDDLLELLTRAKDLRHHLRNAISSEILRADRAFLIDDFRSEARLIFPNLVARGRQRIRSIGELPRYLRDFNLLTHLVVGAFWWLVVVAVWWWARRRATTAVSIVRRLWRGRPWRRKKRPARWPLEQASSESDVTSIAVAFLDLVTGWLLLGPLRDTVPELGLVLLVALQVALYRFLFGLATLAMARRPSLRPAILRLDPEDYDLAVRTLRYLVVWGILRQFSSYVALRILGAVSLDEVLHLVFNGWLIVLLVWILHAWEPALSEAVDRRRPVAAWVGWLLHHDLGIFRAVQSLAAVLYLAGDLLRYLLPRMVSRTPFGRLLERPSIAAIEPDSPSLPAGIVAHLGRDCSDEGYVERTETARALDDRLARWRRRRRRGVVALLGAQGSGRSTFLTRWCRLREKAGGQVTRLRLDRRLATAVDGRIWLAGLAGAKNPSAEEVGARLAERFDDHIVVLEDLHLAFLRKVNGFEALRVILRILHSASSRTFWVVSMHAPSWHYLSSFGGLVPIEVFAEVLALPPFSEDELRLLVLGRTQEAGFEASFRSLVGDNGRPASEHFGGGLRLRDLEAEYFRRLGLASRGNPAVTLGLWRESLGMAAGATAMAGDDGEPEARVVEVRRFPRSGAVADLNDVDGFLLAAIHAHGALDAEELGEVTNMEAAAVHAAVKNLESRRLLTVREGRYRFEACHQAAIIESLRRRHLVHGKID